MPQMVLNRNFLLASTLGHSIAFEKGVPVGVPPRLVNKAMEIGAELVEAAQKEKFLPEEVVAKSEAPDGDDRETAVFEAFRKLEEQAQADPVKGADLFTAGGKPGFKAVSQMTGFKVDAKEVLIHWAAYREMKHNLQQGM